MLGGERRPSFLFAPLSDRSLIRSPLLFLANELRSSILYFSIADRCQYNLLIVCRQKRKRLQKRRWYKVANRKQTLHARTCLYPTQDAVSVDTSNPLAALYLPFLAAANLRSTLS